MLVSNPVGKSASSHTWTICVPTTDTMMAILRQNGSSSRLDVRIITGVIDPAVPEVLDPLDSGRLGSKDISSKVREKEE
jgi:hypothetical protein